MIEISLTPKQADFLTADDFATLFSAGIGCLHESTLIDTPQGRVAISEASGAYRSFNGLDFSASLGSAPFPKGKGSLLRVIHEHGELLAHESHALLCADGEYRLVREPLTFLHTDRESSFDQLLTTWESCLLEYEKDARRLIETTSSSLASYLAYCRQCGLQPLEALSSVQAFVPLLIGALRSCLFFYQTGGHKDDQGAQGLSSSRRGLCFGHRAKQGSSPRAVDQTLVLADFLLASILERTYLDSQLPRLFQTRTFDHHIVCVSDLCRTLAFSLSRPYAISKVIATEKHSTDWYWDLQVPNLHNYTGGGLVHHNSGKSFIGSHWAKEKTINDPDTPGFIGANTYSQLQNATLHTFFGVLEEHHISYKYNRQKNIISLPGTKIFAYSLDNYENIRGIEAGWAWLDETRDTPKEAFEVILGRLRHRGARRRQIKLTSSPSGFNWLYDYFAGPNKKPGYRIIQGSSFDNPFLPTGYIDSLKESYDQKMYEQEVLGQFVNTGVGQIYYAFSRPKNVKAQTINPGFPLLVGMDFNINPMTAVIFQAYGDTVHVLDEVWLMSSNTHEMGEALRHRYGHAYMRVIPDSTGKARKTSSKGLSDHQILKDLGFDVIYANNPARFDRYVCVNNLAEKSRLEIDPKCTHLIDDLEKLTYKDGSTEPDTSDLSRGHIADALGYGCYHAYPLIKHQGGVSMVNR